MKKIFLNLAFAVAMILTLAIVGEIFCRLAMPFNKKRMRYQATRNIIQFDGRNVLFDDELGFVLKPNMRIQFNNEEFRTSVSTNSMGFRDDEASLKDPQIIVSGDSVGFGWGVNKEQTCESFLEKKCGVSVLNICIPGYGTLQEFLALKRYGEAHDLTGKTAAIIFYPNDIVDNIGFGSGSVSIDSDKLTFSKFKKDTFDETVRTYDERSYRGISQNSYMIYVVREGIRDFKKRFFKKNKKNEPAKNSTEQSFGFNVFKHVVKMIKEYSAEKKMRAVFVLVPSVCYYEGDTAVFAGMTDGEVLAKARRILKETPLPMIDMSRDLEKVDYFPYDGHLKASGHNKVALEIKKFLNE